MTHAPRTLGSAGPTVFPLGLGCMGLSGTYGPTDDAQGIATIHAALDLGLNLIDTGDFYGSGHNEMLIGRAIAGRRDQVFLSVKFGAMRGPDGSWGGFDARPAAVKNFLSYTLRRLGTDHVDVYRPSRLDPSVPIEDTVGAIADMVKAGYVRAIGLSEVGPETLERAAKVHPISDLQIEYALVSRGPEERILPTLRRLGIGLTAYGVLSRGMLTGSSLRPGDMRHRFPRFSAENAPKNRKLVEALAATAADLRCTPAQLAFAWVLSRGEDVVPLTGARTPDQLRDIAGALQVKLTAEITARLEAAVPASEVAGTRYDAHGMRILDSER